MKIALYSPFLDENLGGGERYLLTIAEHLSQQHRVDLFLRLGTKDKKDFLKKYALKLNLDLSKVNLMEKGFIKLSFWQRLKQTRDYDAFLYLTDGSFFFSLAKKNIVHFQIPFPQKPKGLINKIKLNNWSVRIANSFFTKTVLEKRWGIKIHFIHRCGPDLNVYKPLKKKKIILNVGRFFSPLGFKHCKRQDFLVATFKKMCHEGLEGWQLIFDGSIDKGKDNWDYAQKVIKIAKGFPIIIRHDSSFSQLRKDYGEALIYWHATGLGIDEEKHPEAVEHLGLSTIEAMASQAIPVVINKGGQKEIVDNGKNGFLWVDQQGLIKYSLKLIKDIRLRKRLAKNAREKAKNFSKQKFNQTTEKIFGLK